MICPDDWGPRRPRCLLGLVDGSKHSAAKSSPQRQSFAGSNPCQYWALPAAHLSRCVRPVRATYPVKATHGSMPGVNMVVRSLPRVMLTRKFCRACSSRFSLAFPRTILSGFPTICFLK